MSDGNFVADISDRSLYAFLEEECSIFIAYGRRFIEAVFASETEARLLEIDIGAPLILLNSVSYLEDGTPIDHCHALHQGDRSRFEVEIVRIREQDMINDITKNLKNNHQVIKNDNKSKSSISTYIESVGIRPRSRHIFQSFLVK